MRGMSERRRAILTFISRHCERQGYPPTVREIGLAVGLASPSTVHGHLAKLEAAGHIRRDPTKPRAMFVCAEPAPPGAGRSRAIEEEPAPPAGALPLVGAVAAGQPRLAEDSVEDWVTVPFEGDFMLRVRGDSMIGAGILDGDLVAVRRQPTAEDGDVVVARIEDEATVKRLRRREGRVVLAPENEAYADIPADDAFVLGRVVGVVRAL